MGSTKVVASDVAWLLECRDSQYRATNGVGLVPDDHQLGSMPDRELVQLVGEVGAIPRATGGVPVERLWPTFGPLAVADS